MSIRDRIKEFRRVPAADLIPAPLNWRTHGDDQRAAIRGLLTEVGIAGAVIAYNTPAGLQLIDGHLRTEEIGNDADIPCLILDVDEHEAKKLLATFDPISQLAGVDAEKLEALLRDVQTSNEAVATMLDELATQAGIVPAVDEQADDGEPDGGSLLTCPQCGHCFEG